MARDSDDMSLHHRLMTAVVRGARAQDESQAAIDAHLAAEAQARRTVAHVRKRREERARALRRLARS